MEKKNQDLKPKSLLDFNPMTPTPPKAKPQLPKCPRGQEWGFSVEPSLLYLRFSLFFECESQSFNFCSSRVRCGTNAQRTNKIQNRTPFVVPQLCNEHSTNRLQAERKHHSSCLSCATKAQRMSGRIFLFPLLSLASLFSLSYVFLGNSMFSLGFCTCPPLPVKEKEG